MKLKDSAWQHGPITYRNLVVWTQKVPPNKRSGTLWFAAIRDEGLALLAYSGPWGSEREACSKLVKAFEAIFDSEPDIEGPRSMENFD